MGTAVGLGLHNLSEGLAIGQSAATGATAFALILVVGFALHNATEGFGIAAPLTTGDRPSWRFLGTLGLIGGGPTFLGGVLGFTFVSPLLSIVFLGLAAGALIYVFNDMMAVSRKFAEPTMANLALLVGLLVAFATDFLLVAIGA
jgi:ZIP family zinc transporter